MTHIAIQEQFDGKAVDWLEKSATNRIRKIGTAFARGVEELFSNGPLILIVGSVRYRIQFTPQPWKSQ
jgi:hypothetical protein